MWTNDTWPKILGSSPARDKTWVGTMLLWPTLFWTHSSDRPFSLLLAQSLTGFLTLQNPLHCLSGVQLDRNICHARYYYINSFAATTKTRAIQTSAFIAYSTHCKPLCSMTSWSLQCVSKSTILPYTVSMYAHPSTSYTYSYPRFTHLVSFSDHFRYRWEKYLCNGLGARLPSPTFTHKCPHSCHTLYTYPVPASG